MLKKRIMTDPTNEPCFIFLTKNNIETIITITILSIVLSSFFLLVNNKSRVINLHEIKKNEANFVGFVSSINTNLEIKLKPFYFFDFNFQRESIQDLSLKLCGVNIPTFKNFEESDIFEFKKDLMKKLKEDFLYNKIKINIVKQDNNLNFLCICETNTLYTRNLNYELLYEGFCTLDYTMEQIDSVLFKYLRSAESQARQKRRGLWKFELLDEKTEKTKITITENFEEEVNELEI